MSMTLDDVAERQQSRRLAAAREAAGCGCIGHLLDALREFDCMLWGDDEIVMGMRADVFAVAMAAPAYRRETIRVMSDWELRSRPSRSIGALIGEMRRAAGLDVRGEG